ncbi:MAG: tryptophan-rich sensory protein [Gemmataceae bacterium]
MLRQLGETVVDATALDHQPELGDSLPGNHRQLRVRFRGGVPGQGSPNRRRAVRPEPRRQPPVHAALLRAEKRASVAVDIVIVWATIIWCVVAVWPHYKWVAVAQGPYFVWVSIATTIQLSITAMN